MMTLVSNDLHSSRVAMALNNMAVSMLERGCSTEALKTLKDSVCMMKALMIPQQHDDDSSSQTKCTDAIMKTAIQRLVKCEKKFASSGSRLLVDIIAVDDGDVSAMRSALLYGPTFSVAHPIRLRDTATNMDDLDLQAGIVLYNMGLSQLLAYPNFPSFTNCNSTTASDQRLAGASKYFSLAHHVLVGFSENNNDSQDEYRSVSRMLVDSLVLSSLCLVLQHQDQIPKARQVMATLEHIKEAVQDHDQINYFPDTTASPAA